MVGLTRHNSNSQLIHYLRAHPTPVLEHQMQGHRGLYQRRRIWRTKEKLSERDIVRLILAFKVGAPKYVIADHYGIGVKTVKNILREYGVKKRSRYEYLE